MPLRAAGLLTTAVVGLISKAAETVDAGNASGFAIAAIIAASCTGAATVIGSITSMILKLRANQTRRRRRAPSRAELERRRAELDAQFKDLEDES